VVHVYPTFRFGIGRRWIASSDRVLQHHLGEALSGLLTQLQPRLVLAPLGVGRHVDHVLTREAGRIAHRSLSGATLAYYSDMPYALHHAADRAYITTHRLQEHVWPGGVDAKIEMIKGYHTQANALYSDGVPAAPDRLWWPSSVNVAAELSHLSTG
jgi:hypothetical protein